MRRVVLGERALALDRGPERVGGRLEGCDDSIAARRLAAPVVRRDDRDQYVAVPLNRLCRGDAAVLLGHARERLHVGDEHDALRGMLSRELVLGCGDEPEQLVYVGVLGGHRDGAGSCTGSRRCDSHLCEDRLTCNDVGERDRERGAQRHDRAGRSERNAHSEVQDRVAHPGDCDASRYGGERNPERCAGPRALDDYACDDGGEHPDHDLHE